MTKSILLELFKENSFSEEELKIIGTYLNRIDLKRGDIVLRQGDTVLYTHYVYSGCLRTYFIDNSGKEHTLQFAIKDWWISDYTAFFSGDKGMMNIECIQDTTLRYSKD